jgi:hypothetical protein
VANVRQHLCHLHQSRICFDDRAGGNRGFRQQVKKKDKEDSARDRRQIRGAYSWLLNILIVLKFHGWPPVIGSAPPAGKSKIASAVSFWNVVSIRACPLFVRRLNGFSPGPRQMR